MSSSTVYFVTGANRSIGLALVTELVKTKPNVYVFAAARTSTPALKELAANHPDKISVVHFVAADEASNRAAAKVVDDKFGRVDTVLGVAGISDFMGTAEETPADLMNEHYKINVTGILVLYQAFAPLLRKSDAPKFIPFSSGAASLTAYINLPAGYTCYGASKVAVNYVARKIHYENEWIICFPLAPGIVKTEMAIANRGMDKTGTLAPIQDAMAASPEVAATMLVNIVESATRDTHGGEFINIDGEKIPW
ncbi:NAD(P)-binding protein [Macrolepiota fuliginosa MF-IS2]|uniref:NAD(P)-binding protein n=1 Tax=Macrolepiota fuliginosa MF-IS2 TaxID=1400762 RepID=A0A9P5X5X5_9AGAR|nr:NAD(P)-binding protein [Macrolepiota fuliginosa MF-IS2]